MSFQSIIGQPLATQLCRRWLGQKTNHPLLFYGPEGVGKRTLALELAKALNCSSCAPSPLVGEGRDGGSLTERHPPPQSSPTRGEEVPIDACDACANCRRIAAGYHPDVRLIDLAYQAAEREEPVEKQQSLRIETVLSERRRLFQTAVEGPWKVTLLDGAHKLTADAANALLKVLEEPPRQTALFLLTPFRERLFATLVSRCQPVRCRPLTDEEMERSLTRQKIPTEHQTRLIELSLGSPGRALRMNREEQIQAALDADRLWQDLPRKKPHETLSLSETRSKALRPNRADIEERIQHLLRPALRALHASEERAAQAVALMQNALTQLRQNVQPGLVYDHLLLQLTRQK